MGIRFPCFVTSCPTNIEFDVVVDPTVAGDLIYEPFVVSGHPEIIEVFAFTIQEYTVVIRFVRAKQRGMESRMYIPSL
jgi:hypothetical protein